MCSEPQSAGITQALAATTAELSPTTAHEMVCVRLRLYWLSSNLCCRINVSSLRPVFLFARQGHNFGMQHDDKVNVLPSVDYNFVIAHCYTADINRHIMANQSLEGVIPDIW
jgi:hypothetical protein